MADETLRNLLKEEKRRREKDKDREEKRRKDRGERDKGERDRGERDKDIERDKKNRDKERDKKHRDKEENKLEKVEEIQKVEEMQNVEETQNIEEYMFIYEDDEGKLYPDLSKINKTEIKIFPVYISGGNSNLTEEIITYKDGKWISGEENTWLNIINDPNIEKVTFDLDDIVVYNNQMFHCVDDLHDYLDLYGPDVLPINK